MLGEKKKKNKTTISSEQKGRVFYEINLRMFSGKATGNNSLKVT